METKIIKDSTITHDELKALAHEQFKERWFTMTLAEQLGNIGSEVGRSAKWQNKDQDLFWGAVTRAMDLFNLTIRDARWTHRLSEIVRSREIFADAVLGGKEYHTSLSALEPYFMQFAMVTRKAI